MEDLGLVEPLSIVVRSGTPLALAVKTRARRSPLSQLVISECSHGASEGATREAGLRHDVVLFRCSKGRMAEKILCSPHVLWIADRPESRGGVAKAVQVD